MAVGFVRCAHYADSHLSLNIGRPCLSKSLTLNSLTIYLAYRFVDFGHTSRLLFKGLYVCSPEKWHPVFESLGALALVWVFLYLLYRLKVFVKV